MKKLVALAVCSMPAALFAQTDITDVISDVTGYKTAAIAVGIAILLFLIGRKVVRKLI